MSEVYYLRGRDITVSSGGEPVGGIVSLKITRKKSGDGIYEFLSSDPAVVFGKEELELELRLRALRGEPVPDLEGQALTVAFGGASEVFDGCSLRKLTSAVNGEETEYTVILTAAKRSFENAQ